MDLELAGKVVLLTAVEAADAIVTVFLQEGARVVLAGDPRPATPFDTNKNFQRVALGGEIGGEDAIAAVAAVVKSFGNPDIIVTGLAGVGACAASGPAPADYEAGWERITYTAGLYRAAVPAMRANKWGRLIYVGPVSSRSLHDFIPMREVEHALGLGLLGLQKATCGEVGMDDITVTSVLHDFSQHPGAPQVAPQDVAAAVAFLASEKGSYLTGIVITVDGGRTPVLA